MQSVLLKIPIILCAISTGIFLSLGTHEAFFLFFKTKKRLMKLLCKEKITLNLFQSGRGERLSRRLAQLVGWWFHSNRWGKTEKTHVCGRKDLKLYFGHFEYEMPLKYPVKGVEKAIGHMISGTGDWYLEWPVMCCHIDGSLSHKQEDCPDRELEWKEKAA